jgi:hypothetical protein
LKVLLKVWKISPFVLLAAIEIRFVERALVERGPTAIVGWTRLKTLGVLAMSTGFKYPLESRLELQFKTDCVYRERAER